MSEEAASTSSGAQLKMLASLGMPSCPYRGVESFRLIDRPIFRARDRDVRGIFRLSSIYRAIAVSGDSGIGKSSLLNAGLIPALIEDGCWVERMRVQPISGNEFFIERLSLGDDGKTSFLPTLFAADDSAPAKISIGADDLIKRLRSHMQQGDSGRSQPPVVLIIDQFEEAVTLFEEAPESREAFHQSIGFQRTMFGALATLITDEELPVKLIFALRDDYLPKIQRHFEKFYPQIKSQVFALSQLSENDLSSIINGPFQAVSADNQPLFSRRLSEQTSRILEAGLRARSDNGLITLTEAQIACRTLWDDPEVEARFCLGDAQADPASAVQQLYDQHLESAMKSLPEDEKRNAKLALTKLVTSAGTRNIVSRDDLFRFLANEGVTLEKADGTMDMLTHQAKLVYLQARGETPFYEIVSESLIAWIAKQAAIFQEEKRMIDEALKGRASIAAEEAREKEQAERSRIKQEEADKAETRLKTYKTYARWFLAGAALVILLFAFAAVQASKKWHEAQAEVKEAEGELVKQRRKQAELQNEREKILSESQAKEKTLEATTANLTADLNSVRRHVSDVEKQAQTYLLAKVALEQASADLKGQLEKLKSQIGTGESDRFLTALTRLQDSAQKSGVQIEQAKIDIANVSNTINDLRDWRTGKAQLWGGSGNVGGFGNTLAFISTWQQADSMGVFRANADRSKPPNADAFDPDKFYIAARWDYKKTPPDWLRKHKVRVRNPRNPQLELEAQPVEWGPPEKTGDLMAISPGLAAALKVKRYEDVSYLNPDTGVAPPLENPPMPTTALKGIKDSSTRAVSSIPDLYVWIGRIDSKDQKTVTCLVFTSPVTPKSSYSETEMDAHIADWKGVTISKAPIGRDAPMTFRYEGKSYKLAVTDFVAGLLQNDHVDLELSEE